MKDENYDTVVKFLNGALKMLQYAHDEMVEFADTGLERELAVQIHKQSFLIWKLCNKVINHQRVLRTLRG